MKTISRCAFVAMSVALLWGCGENTAGASTQTGAAGGSGGEACVSRMSATIMGQRIDNTSCIENVSQPSGEFRAGCEQAAEAEKAMQAESSPEVEIHDASTEYTARGCPANPAARCDGVNNGQVNFHYSGHSADELVALERACGMRGGTWRG